MAYATIVNNYRSNSGLYFQCFTIINYSSSSVALAFKIVKVRYKLNAAKAVIYNQDKFIVQAID